MFGLLTVLAGIIYIAWQYHKERPGGLTMILISVLAVFIAVVIIPYIITCVITDINLELGVVLFVAYIAGLISLFTYVIFIGRDKWLRENVEEPTKIWEEVNALPDPGIEVLLSYRESLGLPKSPINNDFYNAAAMNAWRRNEFNKRVKEKHKIVAYY